MSELIVPENKLILPEPHPVINNADGSQTVILSDKYDPVNDKTVTKLCYFSSYPWYATCSAGSSTYKIGYINLSDIPSNATSITCRGIQQTASRTSGSGAVDTYSGYTWLYIGGSESTKFNTSNPTTTIVNSWLSTYYPTYKKANVHLGFKAESGTGIGPFYGNIYYRYTIYCTVPDDKAYAYICKYNSSGELTYQQEEIAVYQNGSWVNCLAYYGTASGWTQVGAE